MAQVDWGDASVTASWSGAGAYFDGIGLPVGRTLANGSAPALITSLYGYSGGKGAARNITVYLGPAAVGITMGATGAATDTGWLGTSWLVQGGTARWGYNFSGSAWLARSNGGGTTIDPGGGSWPGVLYGHYQYVIGPSAPPLYSATPLNAAGQIQMNFAGPADNGGAGITAYALQYSTTSNFSSNVGQINTGNGGQIVSGLTVGTRYYFRVAAMNAVTSAAGTVGPWSGTVSAIAPGVPSAPTGLTATPSTTVFDRIDLAWTAPANTGGGITGYSIYRAGVKIATTTGTGTTYAATGLADNTNYSFTVAARNAYADTNNTQSAFATAAEAVAPGPPSPPQNIDATASIITAGRITVTWTAPATTGSGGITGYTLYFSTGQVIQDHLASTVTSYNVDNLIPGTSYSFYVRAWNAIADTVGTPGPASATVTEQAMGSPDAPTAMTAVASTVVAGRLKLAWSQTGVFTGFNVYEVANGSATLVAALGPVTTLTLDNLTNTVHTYQISARNAVTDASNPVSEGPRSANFSGTPGTNSTQAVPNLAVTDATNAIYNGTYIITAVTGTTVQYAKQSANIPLAVVSSGTVTDSSNTALNGSKTILAIPNANQFTYSQVTPDVPANTVVLSGSVVDTTNQIYNGTYTVTVVDAANQKVSYSKASANLPSTAVSQGTITNQSNAVYNGTYAITAIPALNQIQYAKTNANIAETTATGTATNVTNLTYYNGTYVIDTTPTYNTFTYNIDPGGIRSNTTFGATTVSDPTQNETHRASTKANLRIMYRSGWAG